jgi:cob(I)alamin adenosyltransferase
VSASANPPRDAPARATKRVDSVVLVNTGDGKGKTTAALGTAFRASGRGWRVCVIQFLKDERWKTGEQEAAKKLGIDWWALGDGFTWDSTDLDATQAKARAAWDAAKAAIAGGEYKLVVLDEATYPITWGWIDEPEVLDTIRQRPAHVNVIVTGRDATAGLTALADTVTEMTKRKHAFDSGVAALRGIDF